MTELKRPLRVELHDFVQTGVRQWAIKDGRGIVVGYIEKGDLTHALARAYNREPLLEKATLGLRKWQWYWDSTGDGDVYRVCICCGRGESVHDDEQCELAAILREFDQETDA